MDASSRLHGLDVLRGIAMILGIFLHGSIAYKAGAQFETWIIDPQLKSYFFDWLYSFIKSFRMQLFFSLAGFFTCLVMSRKGASYFIKNRIQRILIPFMLSYFTILPLTLMPYAYYQFAQQGDNAWQQLFNYLIQFFTFSVRQGFMHLWFLYYLIIFYIVMLLLNWVSSRRNFFKIKVRVSHQMNLVLLIIVGIVTVLSLFNESIIPSIWTGFKVQPLQFIYYGFFYFLGWRLYRQPDAMLFINRKYQFLLLVGLTLSIVSLLAINNLFIPAGFVEAYLVLFKALFSIQTISLSVGFIGFFNTVFSGGSKFSRYLADSAYWVYLIHLPLVLFFQLIFINSIFPGWLRFPLVILFTTGISYLSYHYIIRDKWIGNLLNGKK